MTAYRFRVKFEPDPRTLWRDIVVGEDRTLAEFQSAINRAVGLNQDHLWFIGTDQGYWDSHVQYLRPEEYEQSASGMMGQGEEYNAGETTIAEMARQVDLGEGDRICYLFDYGDEWRFYGILKEVNDEGDSDKQPEVVNEKGDQVDQYGRPGEGW